MAPDGAPPALIERHYGGLSSDVWGLELSADGQPVGAPQPLFDSPAQEYAGTFSPDGKWIAFTSDESGKRHVYVAPFGPGLHVGPATRVSTQESEVPAWTRDGRALVIQLARSRIAMRLPTTLAT